MVSEYFTISMVSYFFLWCLVFTLYVYKYISGIFRLNTAEYKLYLNSGVMKFNLLLSCLRFSF